MKKGVFKICLSGVTRKKGRSDKFPVQPKQEQGNTARTEKGDIKGGKESQKETRK